MPSASTTGGTGSLCRVSEWYKLYKDKVDEIWRWGVWWMKFVVA